MSSERFERELAVLTAKNVAGTLDAIRPLLDKDSAEGMLARGKLFEMTGSDARAVEAYRGALARGAGSEALGRLTVVLLRQGEVEEALARAIELNGCDPDHEVRTLVLHETYCPMTLLGDALVLNRRVNEAREAYERALQANGKNAYAAGRLARIHLANGEASDAARQVELVSSSPRFRELSSILRVADREPSVIPAGGVDALLDSFLTEEVGGRPFVVAGAQRTADPECGAGWASPVAVACDDVGEPQRLELARRWTKQGLDEHASIASFARFVLQLLGLGAPASLVREAVAAMADEVEHASACFGVASALSGAEVRPGPLDVEGALAAVESPEEVLRAVVREGLAGETVSAGHAREAHERAGDHAIRGVLARVAADEARHAELAWSFTEWILERRPAAVGELIGLLEARSSTEADSRTSDPEPTLLRRFGLLSREDRAGATERVLTELVEPRAAELYQRFGASPAPDGAERSAVVSH